MLARLAAVATKVVGVTNLHVCHDPFRYNLSVSDVMLLLRDVWLSVHSPPLAGNVLEITG